MRSPHSGSATVREARVPDHQRSDAQRAQHRGALVAPRTLGVGALMIGAARASRTVALPLWGDHIGLDAATTTLIFGISGAAELLAFYPAGMVMDRFGRQWVVVPSMLLLGGSLALLPLTAGLSGYGVVAGLIGFANGISSGST